MSCVARPFGYVKVARQHDLIFFCGPRSSWPIVRIITRVVKIFYEQLQHHDHAHPRGPCMLPAELSYAAMPEPRRWFVKNVVFQGPSCSGPAFGQEQVWKRRCVGNGLALRLLGLCCATRHVKRAGICKYVIVHADVVMVTSDMGKPALLPQRPGLV